jgi:thioesterase domain-containing protein/acyl carrier protein
VPPGARGEVCVRGANVFTGYESDTPIEALTPDGWFRTGDEGVLDAEGFLFLTGRVQESINRGGEKISPSEVDAAFLEHPDVATATSFAIPHPTLGEEVAAAVVPNTGAVLDEKTLGDFVRRKLSGFKVPRCILVVDDIPKGPTGKVQRHALAAAFGLDDAGVPRSAIAADDREASSLEKQIQGLWAETLGLPAVGLHDDFFLLGGDSLQAIELFLRIEETLGRRLPRGVLFEAGTVAEMARHIGQAVPLRSLVPIQTSGTRPPVFFVHDVYGEVLNFRTLAQYLGPDQPVYGLQSTGLDGNETPLARIEDMAARYLAEVRRVQPQGPYYLGGYSMGGLVAYEMAQQLRAAGDEVALLVLFDTYQYHGHRHRSLLAPAAHEAHLPAAMRGFAWNTKTILSRKLFGLAWRSCERFGIAIPKRLHRPTAASYLAIRSYRMKPYRGATVLFAAARYNWDRKDWDAGWHTLVGDRLTVERVPGQHHEILDEPHVGDLARTLAAHLAERQPEASSLAAAD